MPIRIDKIFIAVRDIEEIERIYRTGHGSLQVIVQSLPLLVDKWTSHDNQLMQAKKMGTVKADAHAQFEVDEYFRLRRSRQLVR